MLGTETTRDNRIRRTAPRIAVPHATALRRLVCSRVPQTTRICAVTAINQIGVGWLVPWSFAALVWRRAGG